MESHSFVSQSTTVTDIKLFSMWKSIFLWRNVNTFELEKIGKMRHFELLFVTIGFLISWANLDIFYFFLMEKIVN